jgi:hypothetical protein
MSATLAAVVAPMVTLATVALADDDKSYVGAECRSINNVDPPVLRPEDGAMINSSLREQTWICPIVRDHHDDTAEYARMTVQEDGTNQIRCEFVARDPKGQNPNTASPGTRKQEILQTSPLQLLVVYTWGEGDDDVFTNKSDGYYFFRCVIPGRTDQGQSSGVINYKVSEND